MAALGCSTSSARAQVANAKAQRVRLLHAEGLVGVKVSLSCVGPVVPCLQVASLVPQDGLLDLMWHLTTDNKNTLLPKNPASS